MLRSVDLESPKFSHTWVRMPEGLPHGKAALVVAHPGHELVVYSWLVAIRPQVFVLTDGSGGRSVPRLHSTRRILNDAKCSSGEIFGLFSDRDLYEELLAGKTSTFCVLAERLAIALVQQDFRYVVGDAYEGFNPAHDVCRLIIDTAVHLARVKHKHEMVNFSFSLIGKHVRAPGRSVMLELADQFYETKKRTAFSYTELLPEVFSAVEKLGEEEFRYEVLTATESGRILSAIEFESKPYYELYGQQQVEAGRYQTVLRYEDHMLPIRRALESLLEIRAWKD